MDGAADKLLAGAAFALNEYVGDAVGNRGQKRQHFVHPVVAAYDVAERIGVVQFPFQFLFRAQVAECLDPADNLAGRVFQECGRNADRYGHAVGTYDIYRQVFHRFAGFHRSPEGTPRLAYRRPEYIAALLADRIRAVDAGDFLSGTVERGDPPILVDSENTVADGVEDDGGIGLIHYRLYRRG